MDGSHDKRYRDAEVPEVEPPQLGFQVLQDNNNNNDDNNNDTNHNQSNIETILCPQHEGNQRR